jgi:hypothetical protein
VQLPLRILGVIGLAVAGCLVMLAIGLAGEWVKRTVVPWWRRHFAKPS